MTDNSPLNPIPIRQHLKQGIADQSLPCLTRIGSTNKTLGCILSFPAALVDIPTHGDVQGLLGVLESNSSVPFKIKRVYFIYGVPSGTSRGSHGHKKLQQLIVPLSGSFDVVLHDGSVEETFSLESPNKGLLIQPGLWRNLINFSNDAVCLVLASEHYDEIDYIRDFDEFIEWVASR